MLEIVVEGEDMWDEDKEIFVKPESVILHLEHSLVSLSKWESKIKKPFLESSSDRTLEEMIYYIKCMTVTKNVKDEVYTRLSDKNFQEINDYINDPMTATWFNDAPGGLPGRKQILTAEVLYYQMLANGIPMECQKWHLNRLITLIRVFNTKNNPQSANKKRTKAETAKMYRDLNAQRRAMYNSKG